MPIFKEIQEQVHQQGVGTVGEVVDLNTLCLFNIALAHEDREAFDAARSVLEAYCAGGDVNLSALLAASSTAPASSSSEPRL